MRSNELRDDGASLTTFEDLAPMVLCFYGICVLVTTVRALRDLYLICLLATGQLSGAPMREIRLEFSPRSELRLSRLQCSSQTVVSHARDGTQRCEGVERLRGLAPL